MAACAWALLLLFAGPAAAQEGSWDARVSAVEGSVTLYSGEAEDGASAGADMPLQEGDRVVTGRDSRAELALDAESIIELGPETDFTVGSLDAKDSWFSLKLGLLSAKVRRLLSDSRLRVRTKGAVASVRGTEFSVETSGPEDTAVAVFDEGEVAVSGSQEGAEPGVLLGANQETEVLKDRKPLPPRALRRLARMRGRLQHIRARREFLRRHWKAIPPERRREIRGKMIEKRRRMRERLQERGQEKRERLRERLQERGRGKGRGKLRP